MSNIPAIVKKTEDVKKFLVAFAPLVSEYATREYSHGAFLKTAMMCILESDELLKCLTTPAGQASMYHALRHAASTGLSLNPQEGKAVLIAYAGKVDYQVMKNGMIELAMDSGKVDFLTADIVYEGDDFKIEKAMEGDKYKFIPALKDRGDILGFFAALKMTDGTVHVKWIDRVNMEAHRDRYGKGLYHTADEPSKGIKKGDPKAHHGWHKSFEGFSLKTVIKALLRLVNISKDLTIAIITDDKFETDVIDFPPNKPGATAEDVKDDMEAEGAPVDTEGAETVETSKEKPDLF